MDDHDWESMSRCIGVAKRRCGKESDPRSKRCRECRAKHKKLKAREHNTNYYQDHADKLNAQRRKLRKRGKVIELLRELFAAGGLPPTKPAESFQFKKARRGRPSLTDEEKLCRKQRLAMSIFVRVRIEDQQPHEAWFSTHPRSTASRKTATREANRLINWYLKEYPPKMQAWLFKYGFDWDAICEAIKEPLNATRYYRGEAIDLPDWSARIDGLKQLMSGLGLATPIGFRAGPSAIGGALEHERIKMNAAEETGVTDSEKDLRRKIRASVILFRHRVERKRLSDCWKELCPWSDASPRSAAKKAQADIDWFKDRFGQTFEQRLVANGLDVLTVLEGIQDMLRATKVSRGVLTDDPDWVVRTKGRELLMVIQGYRHPRRKRGGRTSRVVSMLDAGGHRPANSV